MNEITPELQKIRKLMKWMIGLIVVLIIFVVIGDSFLIAAVLNDDDPTLIPTGTHEVVIFTTTPQLSTPTIILSPNPPPIFTESPTIEPIKTIGPNNQTVPTATWTLPVALTATPMPPQGILLRLSNQAAASQTVEQAQANGIELSNIEARFVPNGLTLEGTLKIPGPGGTTFRRSLQLTGTIEVREKKLLFLVSSLEVGGDDYTDSDYATTIEYIINNWFRSLLVRRDVQNFTVDEEGMLVEAIEYP